MGLIHLQEKIAPPQLPLAWLGVGVMGRSMCLHLLKAGYPIYVHTRTRHKAEDLLEQGAIWCDTPAQAVSQAHVIFTMLGMPQDVEQVYFGSQGILEHAQAESVLIDMTTTRPSLAERIAAEATLKKLHVLDAPVSGGDVGARQASLSIMVGGEQSIFDAVLPLFQILGKQINYQGSAGSGQHTKMCNQIVIASTMVGVCESLLYAQRAGLNVAAMLQSISSGAAGCWTLNNLAPRILKQDYAPGFMVEHFIKDMGIALEEARRLNLALPGLALANQLYLATQAQGHGHQGTHSLILALQALSKQPA